MSIYDLRDRQDDITQRLFEIDITLKRARLARVNGVVATAASDRLRAELELEHATLRLERHTISQAIHAEAKAVRRQCESLLLTSLTNLLRERGHGALLQEAEALALQAELPATA